MTLAEPPAPADQPVNFRHPPVTEVVLAIQFEEKAIDLEVLAEFTGRVKADFPRRAQRPPLPPIEEPVQEIGAAQIAFELVEDFAMPRTWFATEDETKVLQLQEDRFVFNWQRPTPTDADYPRYRQLRESFRERLSQLEDSFKATGRPIPGTNFCEVTYVNQVPIKAGDSELRLSDILSPLRPAQYEFLPSAVNEWYRARFPIAAGDGEPRGSMFVNAAPAIRPDSEPMYVINLSTTLVPAGSDPDSAWTALDLGREWIVKGFVDLTTKEMHDMWVHEETSDG